MPHSTRPTAHQPLRSATSMRPRTLSGRGAGIATGHPAGTEAARQVLLAGGTVADAALAASAVLTVTMPHATSIGGDAFILVREAATGHIHGLNASGMSPRHAGPSLFENGMRQRGPLAPVVPGLVRGWQALHDRFGSTPWPSLLEPAIGLAERGVAVSAALAQTIRSSRSVLETDPGSADLFLPNGLALDVGADLLQPALAASLRAIAAEGADALYRGGVGDALTRRLRELGGVMAMADLHACSAQWVEPVHAKHGPYEIFAMPPNSFGVLMLMQLRVLQSLPGETLRGSERERVPWQIRAMRAVFGNALESIGDPDHMRITGQQLLDETRIEQIASAMLNGSGGSSLVPSEGTACVTVADSAGNAACIVQSIFNPFGAHLLDPQTGIVLNNRMFGFDHRPGRINSVAPGKRCAHTLNPVIATRAGQLGLVYASPGGISQTITGSQILVNLIDRGMELSEAIAAPRWATDRNGDILIEPAMDADLLDTLRGAGLSVRQEENPYLFGSVTAVQRLADGTLRASADTRREAAAQAL